jgi:ABC-type Zn uptake system ZnuABC Zn-binding protein ZnuA
MKGSLRRTGISMFIVIACCFLLLMSCKKNEVPAAQNGNLKIAATIFPLADIAKNIGGDKILVITIMPPGASPHTFEPTYETIRQAGGIRALFKIGCGLDDWAQKVTAALSGNIAVIEVSQGIDLRHFGDGTTDPHYWLSLTNGSIIAKNIAEGLVSLDPANKDYYLRNLAAYQELLVKENEAIKQKMAGLQNKTFVTFHEAWFYFAQAYGLAVAEAFEPFPGKEPTPEFLAHFIKTIKDNNIKIVFTEPQFSAESIRQVANDLHIKINTLDPEGGGSPETKTYLDMMRYNAQTIYKALSE